MRLLLSIKIKLSYDPYLGIMSMICIILILSNLHVPLKLERKRSLMTASGYGERGCHWLCSANFKFIFTNINYPKGAP